MRNVSSITANHFAKNNNVVAIEPSKEMIVNRWDAFDSKA